MAYLLDVNVLIALIDSAHQHHNLSHAWFNAAGQAAWATCPITQNGVIRIVGHKNYPQSAGAPSAVATVLERFSDHPGHEFWSDGVSLLDARFIHRDRLLTSGQVTDSYLLALAVSKGGQLATLDRRLVTSSVNGGAEGLHIVRSVS